ncbi:hypothetical protein GOV06_01865 [Candidatus Woesearchaeota archaeon]|nr:hypothetical protein [Candidatus Woesearchaeota archaeon]
MGEDIKFDYVGYWEKSDEVGWFGIILSEKTREGIITGTCVDKIGLAKIVGMIDSEVVAFEKRYHEGSGIFSYRGFSMKREEWRDISGKVIRLRNGGSHVSALRDIPTYDGEYKGIAVPGRFKLQSGEGLEKMLLDQLSEYYNRFKYQPVTP